PFSPNPALKPGPPISALTLVWTARAGLMRQPKRSHRFSIRQRTYCRSACRPEAPAKQSTSSRAAATTRVRRRRTWCCVGSVPTCVFRSKRRRESIGRIVGVTPPVHTEERRGDGGEDH